MGDDGLLERAARAERAAAALERRLAGLQEEMSDLAARDRDRGRELVLSHQREHAERQTRQDAEQAAGEARRAGEAAALRARAIADGLRERLTTTSVELEAAQQAAAAAERMAQGRADPAALAAALLRAEDAERRVASLEREVALRRSVAEGLPRALAAMRAERDALADELEVVRAEAAEAVVAPPAGPDPAAAAALEAEWERLEARLAVADERDARLAEAVHELIALTTAMREAAEAPPEPPEPPPAANVRPSGPGAVVTDVRLPGGADPGLSVQVFDEQVVDLPPAEGPDPAPATVFAQLPEVDAPDLTTRLDGDPVVDAPVVEDPVSVCDPVPDEDPGLEVLPADGPALEEAASADDPVADDPVADDPVADDQPAPMTPVIADLQAAAARLRAAAPSPASAEPLPRSRPPMPDRRTRAWLSAAITSLAATDRDAAVRVLLAGLPVQAARLGRDLVYDLNVHGHGIVQVVLGRGGSAAVIPRSPDTEAVLQPPELRIAGEVAALAPLAGGGAWRRRQAGVSMTGSRLSAWRLLRTLHRPVGLEALAAAHAHLAATDVLALVAAALPARTPWERPGAVVFAVAGAQEDAASLVLGEDRTTTVQPGRAADPRATVHVARGELLAVLAGVAPATTTGDQAAVADVLSAVAALHGVA